MTSKKSRNRNRQVKLAGRVAPRPAADRRGPVQQREPVPRGGFVPLPEPVQDEAPVATSHPEPEVLVVPQYLRAQVEAPVAKAHPEPEALFVPQYLRRKDEAPVAKDHPEPRVSYLTQYAWPADQLYDDPEDDQLGGGTDWDEEWVSIDQGSVRAPAEQAAYVPVDEHAATPPIESNRRNAVLAVLGGLVGLLVALALAVGVVMWSRSGTPAATLAAHHKEYKAPVPLALDTSYVRTRVLPSGDLVVSHWIRSSSPIYQMTVDVPEVAGVTPTDISVSNFSVASDGVLMSTAPNAVVGGKDSLTSYFFVPGAHVLFVSYQLSGVTQHDSTIAHRALVRVTALKVTTDVHIQQETATLTGAKVLALACSPAQPQALPVPCGTVSDGSWSVDLHGTDVGDRVMAQVELSGSS